MPFESFSNGIFFDNLFDHILEMVIKKSVGKNLYFSFCDFSGRIATFRFAIIDFSF